ncbi:hypothetical protein SOASR030_12100 [Leminorella grimontii]|uniref:DUF4358 domain-containing protein n=2 Tax=Leminorella grimontii TaxID=82981 RepID=A0AAV5N0Q5_9GAMM|nr:hypothetical protein SOASR030_12100 [Leminorella grimontii]GKX58522.1 hypothetical protein SOASR031_08370 [Leminorella grimontii]
MMKKISFIFGAFLMLLLTGCDMNKPEITAEQFQTAMEAEGFTMDNSKDSNGKDDVIKRYLIAEKDGVAVNFLTFSNEAQATRAYSLMQKKYEEEKSASNLTSSNKVSMGNYNKYSLRYNDNYALMSQIGSTLIYVGTQADKREWIASVVEKLGY